MHRLRRITVVLVACIATSCGRASEGPILRLPSGKEIRELQIGIMNFSADKPAWMLRYETKTPINDLPQLREEALEVFEQYRSAVERAGNETAILSANEPAANAVVAHIKTHNFVLRKQPDSTWKATN